MAALSPTQIMYLQMRPWLCNTPPSCSHIEVSIEAIHAFDSSDSARSRAIQLGLGPYILALVWRNEVPEVNEAGCWLE